MAKANKKPEIKSVGLNVIDGGQPREKRIQIKDNTSTATATEMEGERKQAYQSAKMEIARCAHNIGMGFYQMGQALKDVRDRELWKEGKAKSWTEFAKSIDGVTYATVCNLISVVENLDAETAARLGPSISYAVARAPGEQCKAELVQLASEGASCKVVKQRAHEQRITAGTDVPGRGKRKDKATKIRKDLESKASADEHDAKVSTVAKGECKLTKGKGTFTIDGITIEVKMTGKTKLEYVARLD